MFDGEIRKNINTRGHPRTFREGEVLRQFQDLREKFGLNFGFPYTFYIFSLLPQLKIGRGQLA